MLELRPLVAPGRLQEVARAALDEPTAILGEWKAEPLQEGPASTLHRVSGISQVGTAQLPWRLVLKALRPPGDPEDPTSVYYPRRELRLYQSGILNDLPGISTPRCYGWDEDEDGGARFWLEHVEEEGERRWSLDRWAAVAQDLGRFNGAYLSEREPPSAPWLGGRRLRTWLKRHAPLVKRIAVAPGIPEVSRFWPQPVVDALLRLWEERDLFCTALERLPQTFSHGDAIRRNLFSGIAADGSPETVAIDWEYAGFMAPGEEIGQTASVAAAFHDIDPADLPALDEALFSSYLSGLHEAGWRGSERQVRFAYAAHAALRNAFNAVGATPPSPEGEAAARARFGDAWLELAEARAAVRPFLLERAQEARDLMRSLG